MDSSRAASMKAQVLATTRSAFAGDDDDRVALGLEESRQLVGVHVVLGAPERLDPVPHTSPQLTTTPSALRSVVMAEREGFEPSGPLSQAAFLAGMWFKPNSPTSPSQPSYFRDVANENGF